MPNRDLGFSLLVRSVPSSLAGLISSALTSRLGRPPTTTSTYQQFEPWTTMPPTHPCQDSPAMGCQAVFAPEGVVHSIFGTPSKPIHRRSLSLFLFLVARICGRATHTHTHTQGYAACRGHARAWHLQPTLGRVNEPCPPSPPSPMHVRRACREREELNLEGSGFEEGGLRLLQALQPHS